jgi:hypothetical protein
MLEGEGSTTGAVKVEPHPFSSVDVEMDGWGNGANMVSYQDLYKQVEKPLTWAAEDHGGMVTRKEIKMIIMEHCNVIDRSVVNSKIQILEMFKVLIPVNKTTFRFVPDGKGSKNASDGEKAAIEKEVKRIAGKAVI